MYKIPDVLVDIINDMPSKRIARNIVSFSDDNHIELIVIALISFYVTTIDNKAKSKADKILRILSTTHILSFPNYFPVDYVFTVDLIHFDTTTDNGMIYDLESFDTRILSETNKFLIELGDSTHTSIDLSRVAIVIKRCYIVGKVLKAEIKVLDTPMGRIVKSLLDTGTELFLTHVGTAIRNNNTLYEFCFKKIWIVSHSEHKKFPIKFSL